jgi:hypothetical protein
LTAIPEESLAWYVGDRCFFCKHIYADVADLRKRKAVRIPTGQIACGACYEKVQKQ